MTSFVTNLFDFQPLNTALKFPQDLYTLPIALLTWAVLHKTLQIILFNKIEQSFFPESTSLQKLKTESDSTSLKKLKIDRLKLSTAAWKAVYFTICFSFGAVIMVMEYEWFFQPKEWFRGWPGHEMSDLVKFYYVMEMAGYVYSILILPFEAKQKKIDILAYLVHHGSTLFLMWVSYIYSFHRIGVVIAFLHDVADPWMEYAKLWLYSGRTKVADVFFTTFAAVFIVTRNFIFPFYVITSIPKYCRFEDGTLMPTNGMNYALQIALWTLECLHIYWGGLILNIALKAVISGKLEDDTRNVDDVNEDIIKTVRETVESKRGE